MRQIQHVVALWEFQRQILGANPKDLVKQQEPAQTMSLLTLYLGRAPPSPPSSHIYFGSLERAQLVLAATLVMQDPNPAGRAGRGGSCSGQVGAVLEQEIPAAPHGSDYRCGHRGGDALDRETLLPDSAPGLLQTHGFSCKKDDE